MKVLSFIAVLFSSFVAVAAPPKTQKPSAAPQVKAFFPQNLTDTVNQVRVEFTTNMVPLSRGDQNADIFNVSCSPALKGYPRWQNQKNWTYDFQTNLMGNKIPGGSRCQFELKKDVKSLDGKAVSGTTVFTFQVDGPNVVLTKPDGDIVEDQLFVLYLDSAVEEASVVKNSYFIVEGKANRVPLEIVTGAVRDAILSNVNRYGREVSPDMMLVVKSREVFPAKAKVRLVWGAGIKAVGANVAKVKSTNINFVVRNSFAVEFSCERENAKADCSPLSEMRLNFSAPITANLANQMYIEFNGQKYEALLGEDANSNFVNGVMFKGPFPASKEGKVVIPAGMKDDAGRPLANQAKFPLKVMTAELPPLAKFSAKFGVLEAKQPNLLPVTIRNLENQVYGSSALLGKYLKVQDLPEMVAWITKVNEHERDLPLFDEKAQVKKFQVPMTNQGKAFEVVGIPLNDGPGLYVVELQSKRLGESLVGRNKVMYVPTTVLVTDLAVHIKWGRENSVFWVTSLDSGNPVPNAKVAVYACDAKKVWEANSDSSGLVTYNGDIKTLTKNCQSQKNDGGYLVTAQLGNDMTFATPDFSEGIETWRFGTSEESIFSKHPAWTEDSNILVHTIFARTLLRAGEVVNMKHVIRRPVGTGFQHVTKNELPKTVLIKHMESDTSYEVPVTWNESNFTAVTEFKIPADAILGTYSVSFKNADSELRAGSFQVEEFKIPLYKGTIVLPKTELVKPTSVNATVAVNYQNGGPVSGLKGTLRYFVSDSGAVRFSGFEGFQFSNGTVKEGVRRSGDVETDPSQQKVVDQNITLDEQGTAQVTMSNLGETETPKLLNVELEYRDSNGETQTVGQIKNLWPSSRHIGMKVDKWISGSKDINVKVAVTDLQGKALAGAPFSLKAYKTTRYSHRTRLVGGFYSYESITEVKEIPVKATCQAKQSNEKGLASCLAQVSDDGEIALVATTVDEKGNAARSTVYAHVRGKNDMWFEADNNDRIDLIAEKKNYDNSETARFQVRMPFHEATALVTVEREGILSAQVVKLAGVDPTISVPLKGSYAPNIYVSTFVVRGRVPGGPDETTAIVDLAKPSFKMGLTSINVNWKAHALKVDVVPSKTVYSPREEATVQVKAVRADGSALPAGAEVALAVVDEGLLLMAPNRSWDILRYMMNTRALEVQTATVQMQVIGKRHFGLKAVPHGGGGGQQMTRELFDTLVYWNGSVKLDQNGLATVKFKMNDSMTKFRIVAVAHAGEGLFGTGETSVTSTQDLITTTSLPATARPGDQFPVNFTFRNTTKTAIEGTLSGRVTFRMANGTSVVKQIPPTLIKVDGNASKTLAVTKIEIPEGATESFYEVEIVDSNGKVRDRIKETRAIKPQVYVRTYMSTLKQITEPLKFDVERPQDSSATAGGVQVTFTPTLASGLTSVTDFMNNYPWASFEFLVSQAVITGDSKQWSQAMAQLPALIDENGFIKFYPTSRLGSEVLTAYVLTIANLGQKKIPETLKPRLVQALRDFYTGKTRRSSPVDAATLFSQRVFVAETMVRLKALTIPQITNLLNVQTNQMGTATLLSLWNVLNMIDDGSLKTKKDEVTAAVEARLTLNGTRYGLTNTSDSLWLINSDDASMARLVLSILQSESLSQSMGSKTPEILRGLLAQNKKGYWDTTVSNAFATVALRAFSAQFEKVAVSGTSVATTTTQKFNLDWAVRQYGGTQLFGWLPSGKDSVQISHNGQGAPWALVTTQAAVYLKVPLFSGMEISKRMKPLKQQKPGIWSVGDIAQITLKIKTNTPAVQVALMDPIPTGTRIINVGAEEQTLYPEYDQRSYEGYKAFYDYVSAQEHVITYQIEFNQAGSFKMPSTRVQAVYNSENFAEMPNTDISVY